MGFFAIELAGWADQDFSGEFPAVLHFILPTGK